MVSQKERRCVMSFHPNGWDDNQSRRTQIDYIQVEGTEVSQEELRHVITYVNSDRVDQRECARVMPLFVLKVHILANVDVSYFQLTQ